MAFAPTRCDNKKSAEKRQRTPKKDRRRFGSSQNFILIARAEKEDDCITTTKVGEPKQPTHVQFGYLP